MNMPSQPSGLYLASQAQQLARNAEGTDAMLFQKIALASMVTVALGSLLQVTAPIIKDLFKKHPDKDNYRGR